MWSIVFLCYCFSNLIFLLQVTDMAPCVPKEGWLLVADPRSWGMLAGGDYGGLPLAPSRHEAITRTCYNLAHQEPTYSFSFTSEVMIAVTSRRRYINSSILEIATIPGWPFPTKRDTAVTRIYLLTSTTEHRWNIVTSIIERRGAERRGDGTSFPLYRQAECGYADVGTPWRNWLSYKVRP